MRERGRPPWKWLRDSGKRASAVDTFTGTSEGRTLLRMRPRDEGKRYLPLTRSQERGRGGRRHGCSRGDKGEGAATVDLVTGQ